MPEAVTSDQVLEAAKGLEKDEFTRGDIADKLGVEKREIRKGFQAARKAGELEKTRDDEENTGHFKLTGQASA